MEIIDYIPLHGSVLHPELQFVFGTTELASAFRKDNDKWGILTFRLQTYPTIFIGYSLQDSGVLEALDPSTIHNREHKQKWILLRDKDPSGIEYFRALGFNIVISDTELFLDYLYEYSKSSEVNELDTSVSHTASHSVNIFPAESIPDRTKIPVRSLVEFYSGAEPIWYDIFFGQLHKNQYYRKIVDSIDSSKNTIILGSPACGKTTLLMQVASDYNFKGYKLFAKSLTSEKADLLIRKLNGSKALIFIDDFTNDIEAFKKLSSLPNIQVIGADRDFNYEISPYRYNENDFNLLHVVELGSVDIQSIYDKIPPEIKTKKLKIPPMSEGVNPSLLEFMEQNILKEKTLKYRFKQVIKQLKSEVLLSELFIMLCYVDYCRVPVSYDMIFTFLRGDVNNFEKVYEMVQKLGALVFPYEGNDGNSSEQDFFMTRSKLVSETVIEMCPATLLKTVLLRFHENVPSFRIHMFDTFKRKAYDADIIARAFQDWEEGKEFYEMVYSKAENQAYFLRQQGALYLKRKGRYSDSYSWIDQALRDSSGKIFSIKTSYAIILFEANIRGDENDPIIKDSLDDSMRRLEECYKLDKRKAYHTECYAHQAIKYWEKYGKKNYNALRYLEVAQSWLEKEIPQIKTGTRNPLKMRKIHQRIAKILGENN